MFSNILFVAHFIACIWLFVHSIEVLNSQKTWLTEKENFSHLWYRSYLKAIYFSVVTMVKNKIKIKEKIYFTHFLDHGWIR